MSDDTSGLADAVADTLRLLPLLDDLIGAHDNDGTTARALNHVSAPPWNAAVAHVKLDIHEGARRLEAELREALTGRPARPRGGSDANTEAALRAIADLGVQLGLRPAQAAALLVDRWAAAARRLPAVDEEPAWRRLTPGPDGLPPRCPYCGTFSLRVAVRSRVVRCFYPGPCRDSTGQRPTASLELGRVSGEPMLVWADGMVQVAPA